MTDLTRFEKFQINFDNLNIINFLQKCISKCAYVLNVIAVLVIFLNYCFLYNCNLYVPYIITVFLNIIVSIIITIFAIRDCYNNHMKYAYNQLHEYLEILSECNESPTIAFSHDIKNIIFSLSSYMYFKDYDKAQQKIEHLCDIIQLAKNKNYIGICCIDKLIYSKVREMNKLNIKFDIINDLSSHITANNLDLCILIGNSLDNAIEACSKIPCSQNKYINLSLANYKDFLEITVCNSTIGNVNPQLKTSKSNHKYHGFGVKNMKTILQKYHGTLHINQSNEYFTIVMKINLKVKH